MNRQPEDFSGPIIEAQKQWIRSGKIGCVFASYLVKYAETIGWRFVTLDITERIADVLITPCYMISIIFPGANWMMVREWALRNYIWTEPTADGFEGLRIKVHGHIAWVQYFGPDAYLVTRQAPHPMLAFTVMRPLRYYFRVPNGPWNSPVNHLAHASVDGIPADKQDRLWELSFANTKRKLGHSPTAEGGEQARSTFKVYSDFNALPRDNQYTDPDTYKKDIDAKPANEKSIDS